jgi:hypothetical protein
VWWSELGDGLSYSSLNTLQIEPGIGGHVQQLFPLRGFTPSIVVFKERAIATIEPYWGSSSHLIPAAGDALDTLKTNIRLIANGTGCVAPLSVQFVPGGPGGDIYFLAKDGVRALTRANDDTISGVSKPISDSILTTIRRINFSYAHKVVSAVLDTRYHLAVPLDGATDNTHVLTFDFETEAWSVQTWHLHIGDHTLRVIDLVRLQKIFGRRKSGSAVTERSHETFGCFAYGFIIVDN